VLADIASLTSRYIAGCCHPTKLVARSRLHVFDDDNCNGVVSCRSVVNRQRRITNTDIRGFTTIRYINRLFTYFTYLITYFLLQVITVRHTGRGVRKNWWKGCFYFPSSLPFPSVPSPPLPLSFPSHHLTSP